MGRFEIHGDASGSGGSCWADRRGIQAVQRQGDDVIAGFRHAAAKKFLEEHGYDVSGMKVSMHVDDIGGPSAGMMYTLGLIDKVTGEKLLGVRSSRERAL